MKKFLLLIFCIPSFFFFKENNHNKIPFSVLLSGDNSNQSHRQNIIINNEASFDSLYNSIGDFIKKPKINFNKSTVVACFAGSQTNGMKIDSVCEKNESLVIYITRISFKANCHGSKLLVTPFEIIEIPKGNWNKCLEKAHVEVRSCD